MNEEGVPDDEENFEEAVKAINTALHDNSVPQSVQAILDHPLVSNITGEVSDSYRVAQFIRIDFLQYSKTSL